MKMKMSALAMLVCGMVACGDEYNPNGGGPTNPNNNNNNNTNNNNNNATGGAADAQRFFGDAFKLAQQAICKQAFQCPESADPNFVQFVGRYSSESACASANDLAVLLGGLGLPTEGLEAGRQRFDTAAAQRCMDALRAEFGGQGCIAGTPLRAIEVDASCDALIVGLVPTGGACVGSDDCAVAGDRCAMQGGECYGTCQPSGDPTECDSGCGADRFCDYSAGTPACAARKGAGESCQDTEECVASAVCAEQDGVCVARGSAGEGEPCGDEDAVCASGLRCTDDEVCGKNTVIDAGGTCTLSSDGTICRPGSVCLLEVMGGQISGRCGAPRSQGSSCYALTECQPGLTCITAQAGMPGQCGPAKEDGQPCSSGSDCKSFRCDDETNTCAPLLGGGEEQCVIPAGM